MESFLTSVGAFTILAIIFYLCLRYIANSQDKERENRELAKYLNLNAFYWDKKKSYDDNIKKILSDPEVRKIAEEAREKAIKQKQKDEDKRRKEDILNRTFSYKYENVIFEIFAPFANKKKYPSRNEEEWECTERLEVEFIKNELMRLCNVTYEDAEELITKFEQHKLLTFFTRGKKKCFYGNTLKYDWNIISDEDMNLSKWIQQHPGRESRESAESRRKPYDIVKRTPFSSFIKKYGDFKVEGDGTSYYLYFNNKTAPRIYIPYEYSKHYDNRYAAISGLGSFFSDTEDFIVIDDDGQMNITQR